MRAEVESGKEAVIWRRGQLSRRAWTREPPATAGKDAEGQRRRALHTLEGTTIGEGSNHQTRERPRQQTARLILRLGAACSISSLMKLDLYELFNSSFFSYKSSSSRRLQCVIHKAL